MGRKVFISYARADLAVVAEMAKDLAVVGLDVWLDQDLEGGDDWWDEILHRIELCDVFIVAMSARSLWSVPCRREYEFAVALRRAILPVRVDDLGAEPLVNADLARRQHIDYAGNDKQATLRLIRTIDALPAADAAPVGVVKPKAPISDVDLMGADVAGDQPLDETAQLLILARLTAAASDPLKQPAVSRLIQSMRSRRDTLASVDRELGALSARLASTVISEAAAPTPRSNDPQVRLISRERRSIHLSIEERGETWLLRASGKVLSYSGNARLELDGVAVKPSDFDVKLTGDVVRFAPILSNGRQLVVTIRASDLGAINWVEVKSDDRVLFVHAA